MTLIAAIDTTADTAGAALFDDERLLWEMTWYSRLSHSRDLLPVLDGLLQRAGRTKADLGGIGVCVGPGSYAGMRVGISTAKALAYALGLPLAGVNRLQADAFAFAGATRGRIVPLHAAGRAEIAWAAYATAEAGVRELLAPRLTPVSDLPDQLLASDLICAEAGSLAAPLLTELAEKGLAVASPPPSRVIAVGRLAVARLAAGESDDANSLAPLYLRAPAIGPQPPLPA